MQMILLFLFKPKNSRISVWLWIILSTVFVLFLSKKDVIVWFKKYAIHTGCLIPIGIKIGVVEKFL